MLCLSSFSLITKIQQPPCLLPGEIKNYAIAPSLKNRRNRSSAIFLIQEFIPTDLSCNREKTNNDVPAIGLIAIKQKRTQYGDIRHTCKDIRQITKYTTPLCTWLSLDRTVIATPSTHCLPLRKLRYRPCN